MPLWMKSGGNIGAAVAKLLEAFFAVQYRPFPALLSDKKKK